jgi:hypothetical protein
MIVNKQQMLDANSRCEEWSDARITKFMTTAPYTKKGEKTIQNFIDSIGICNITYEEIFWVVINNHLTKEDRICVCIDHLYSFSLKLGENFYPYINRIKLVADTYKEQDIVFEINSIIYDMNFHMTDITKKLGDVNSKYKLYKLTKVFLENILNDTDMIAVTKKICDIIVLEFSNDYSYNSILNEIQSLYE